MKKLIICAAALGLVTTASVATARKAARKAKIPTAVQRAAERVFGKKHAPIEREVENGKTVYEVETKTELEVVFDARGQVVEYETEVPVELVPSAARRAARTALGATPSEASAVIRGSKVVYELEASKGGKDVEVIVTPAGTVLDKLTESDDDDDD